MYPLYLSRSVLPLRLGSSKASYQRIFPISCTYLDIDPNPKTKLHEIEGPKSSRGARISQLVSFADLFVYEIVESLPCAKTVSVLVLSSRKKLISG